MLPVVVAQSSYDGNAVYYLQPTLRPQFFFTVPVPQIYTFNH